MSPQFMDELVQCVPEVVTIKLEDIPTGSRMSQTAAALPAGRITFQAGLSGVWLLDELRAGASGAMTGFPYPQILVEICHSFRAGDEQHPAELYYRSLPLMVLDGEEGTGDPARKIVQGRRG